MKHLVSEVMSLVRRVDPGLRPQDIPTELLFYHEAVHRRENDCLPANTTTIRRLTLDDLMSMAPCKECYISSSVIASSIEDAELSEAVDALWRLDAVVSRPSSETPPVSSRATIQELFDFTHDFVTADNVERNYLGEAFWQIADKYRQVVDVSIDEATNHLAYHHRATLGSSQFQELLYSLVHKKPAISSSPAPEHTTVMVALASIRDVLFDARDVSLTDTEKLAIVVQASFAFDQSYGRAVHVLPRWVASFLQEHGIGSVISSFHTTISPEMLETATKLWSNKDTEVLFHFDAALLAAKNILVRP